MAQIAALLVVAADRDALLEVVSGHTTVWAEDWRDLMDVVKREPVAMAVADLHAEPGKDGALRVYRFHQKYPLTPLLVWGDLDGRDLFRLGKAGAHDVIMAPDADNGHLVSERVREAAKDRLAHRIDQALRPRVGSDGRALVQSAAEQIPDGVQVPTLAETNGFSISTLERRCQEWGLTTPGRILLWLRIIYGLNWLQEPGRSVESVAAQVGYSSGAAFRRAIKATLERPTGLRKSGALDRAVHEFALDNPGDPTLAGMGAA